MVMIHGVSTNTNGRWKEVVEDARWQKPPKNMEKQEMQLILNCLNYISRYNMLNN